MTIKELQEQLKLAKNKEAKVLFRLGNDTLVLELMAEVVNDGDNVRFPSLGENTNAVAIKLAQKTPVKLEKNSE